MHYSVSCSVTGFKRHNFFFYFIKKLVHASSHSVWSIFVTSARHFHTITLRTSQLLFSCSSDVMGGSCRTQTKSIQHGWHIARKCTLAGMSLFKTFPSIAEAHLFPISRSHLVCIPTPRLASKSLSFKLQEDVQFKFYAQSNVLCCKACYTKPFMFSAQSHVSMSNACYMYSM